MAIKILENIKTPRRIKPGVTINFGLKRLNLNRAAVELLNSHYQGETEHLQILFDDQNSGIFWIRLCEAEAVGSKKMRMVSPGTRSVNISLLLSTLNLGLTETARVDLVWDEKVGGAKIDLTKVKEVKGTSD